MMATRNYSKIRNNDKKKCPSRTFLTSPLFNRTLSFISQCIYLTFLKSLFGFTTQGCLFLLNHVRFLCASSQVSIFKVPGLPFMSILQTVYTYTVVVYPSYCPHYVNQLLIMLHITSNNRYQFCKYKVYFLKSLHLFFQ